MKTLTPTSDDTAVEGGQRAPPARWALAGLSLSMLLASLGGGIASVALPALAQAFDASFQDVQWIVLAYLLAVTTLAVGVGRLGDIMGRRRLLLAGIVLFSVASVLCGATSALWALVAARAAQGAGAAIMTALAIAFVGDVIPKERTGAAMGLLGTMSAFGTALGPSLGGLLIAELGWPAIFLVNGPLGALAFWIVWRRLPVERRDATSSGADFDVAGALVLALTLAALTLAMTLGRGGFGLLNPGLLGCAIFGAGLFVWIENRAPAPLVQMAMFRSPALSAGLAASALVATVLMATLVVGPFYLSRALGLDTALAGAVLSVGPLVAALTGAPAGRLVDRYGSRPMTILALVAVGGGCTLLFMTPTAYGVPGYLAGIAVMTSGYALFQTANNTGVMTGVPAARRGVTSGLLTLFRNLGLIAGASFMGAVFAFASGSADVATAAPEAVAAGMRAAFQVATLLVLLALAVTLGGRRAAQPQSC